VIAETLLEQVTQNNYNIPETDLPETGIVIEADKFFGNKTRLKTLMLPNCLI
jgi:hypothetical protein